MSSSAQKILDDCEALLEKGFSIIPCSPDKKPMLGWKKYQEYSPTMDDIRRWTELYPSMGIGIITGTVSEIVVIDVDVKGHKPSFNDLINAGLPITRELLESTTIVRTGGGGGHFYFKYSDSDIKNHAGIIRGSGFNVDIRGEGGYVVAPPSMHESGNVYKWVRNNVIAPLPMDLMFLLQEHSLKPNKEKFALGSEIPSGTKHSYLIKLAGKLMRSARFTEDELFSVLITTLAIRQSPNDVDIVPEENIRRMAHDAWVRWRKDAPEQGEPTAQQKKSYVISAASDVIAGAKSKNREGTMTGMPGLDEMGGVAAGFYILVADPGVGKSTYYTQSTWMFHDAGLKVAVFSAEMMLDDWCKWAVCSCESMKCDDSYVMPSRWEEVWGSDRMMLFPCDSIDVVALRNTIEEHRPDVVILDNLTDLEYPEKGGTNDFTQYRNAAKELRAMTRQFNVSIHALAHTKVGIDLERTSEIHIIADSSGYSKSADVICSLYLPRNVSREAQIHDVGYRCHKNRLFGFKGITRLSFNEPTRRFDLSVNTTKP